MRYARRFLPLLALLLAAACGDAPAPVAGDNPALFDPSRADAQAPASFRVKFETTAGDFVVEFTRAWAPHGVDRVYNLVRIGYFTDIAFFRVKPTFMVQFGLHGNPGVNGAWRTAYIPDDPVKQSNTPGMVSFAKLPSPGTRSVQLFVNYVDNSGLDAKGFAPVGRVVEGMEHVRAIHAGYMEMPRQELIHAQGNDYLKKNFPRLDYIRQATLVE